MTGIGGGGDGGECLDIGGVDGHGEARARG